MSQPSSSPKIYNLFANGSHRQWYPIINCEIYFSVHRLIFSSETRFRMASWISSILLSLSLPVSCAKGSEGDAYFWLQQLVNIFSIFCDIMVLNRIILDSFRDVCLLDTSNSLFCPLFNNQKYESCTYRGCYDMYVDFMSNSNLSSIMTLIICCGTEVLFYGFCE